MFATTANHREGHFHVHAHHFQPSPLVATSSAVAAVAGGIVAAVDSNQLPAWIGLATLAGSIITAACGGLGTWFKAWLDYRSREEAARHERHVSEEKSRWERHDIANKLNLANLRITAMNDEIKHLTTDNLRLTAEIAENRQTIEKLRNGHQDKETT